jgi:flagellar protein FliJ
MASTLPLETLTGLARDRTDEAARRLASLTTASDTAAHKLEALQQYRRDYAEQLRLLMECGLDAPRLRNYREFLAALDRGIAQQRSVAEQAHARLLGGRGQWQQEHRRLNAFETLAERRQREHLLQQGRREQRAGDEQAARMVMARALAGGGGCA